MSTLWQSSNCFKSWYWTLTVFGDLQRERGSEREGAAIRKIGNCPTFSQRTVPGHLFILLFAHRRCSRLWGRNSISILSFTVFLLSSILPPHFNQTVLCLHLSSGPFFLYSLLFSFSLSYFYHSDSHISSTHTHTHKRFSSVLLASGVAVWVHTVLIFFAFKSVITSGIMPNAVSFPRLIIKG